MYIAGTVTVVRPEGAAVRLRESGATSPVGAAVPVALALLAERLNALDSNAELTDKTLERSEAMLDDNDLPVASSVPVKVAPVPVGAAVMESVPVGPVMSVTLGDVRVMMGELDALAVPARRTQVPPWQTSPWTQTVSV